MLSNTSAKRGEWLQNVSNTLAVEGGSALRASGGVPIHSGTLRHHAALRKAMRAEASLTGLRRAAAALLQQLSKGEQARGLEQVEQVLVRRILVGRIRNLKLMLILDRRRLRWGEVQATED